MKWMHLILSGLAVTTTSALAVADEPVLRVTQTPHGNSVVTTYVTPTLDLGKYWIGVSVSEVPEALREHLDLQDGVGVVASEIVEKGPAQTAGISKHDILLKAGEIPLKSAKSLIDAVNRAEKNDLSVEIIHKGQKKTVAVKPAERPADQVRTVTLPGRLPPQLQMQLDALNQQNGQPMIFVQPGFPVGPNNHVMGYAQAQAQALPNGVSVSITRTNSEPAKINVKRGKESWEITEEQLDKLPADLRPHVEAMLGRNPFHAMMMPGMGQAGMMGPGMMRSIAPQYVPVDPTQIPQNVKPVKPQAPGAARKQPDDTVKKSDLKELEEQIKELSKKLDQLKKD